MPTFGSRLKRERVRRSLTQSALAELGGVKPNAQGHYESGCRFPKADYLQAISKVIDVSYLITNSRSPDPTMIWTPTELHLLSIFRKMCQRDQDGLVHLFEVLDRNIQLNGK